MDLELFLPAISSFALLINLVTFGLYLYSRSYLSKIALSTSICHVIPGFIMSMVSSDDHFIWAIVFATTFPLCYSISLVLQQIYQFSPKIKQFTYFLGICLIISLILNSLSAPFWLLALPIALGSVAPLLYRTIQAIYYWNYESSKISKSFVIVCILFIIHHLDYPFVALNESATMLGVILNTILTSMCLIMISGIELERVTTLRIRAQELDGIKSRFFANISHEIRTPLTLLLGPLEKLGADPALADNEKARHFLGTARSNGQRLLQLINQLLDASKLEAGKMQLNLQPCQAASLAKELTDLFSPLAASKNINLLLRTPDQPITFYCDLDKIQKILYNLLSNAIKFSPSHAKVMLSLSQPSPP